MSIILNKAVRNKIMFLLLNRAGAVCGQILVFVLQMEESNQSTWMGWNRIAWEREGESPILPDEEAS
jgi:hypothetical protein